MARYGEIDDEHMSVVLPALLRLDSNCIDVGANVGEMMARFHHLAPHGRHIAYEPLPHLYRQLVKRFPDVDVRCAAASSVDGESSFTHVRNMSGFSGFRRRDYPAEPDIEFLKVRTERIDDHLPPGYVPTLIKIDVEGAVQWVLEGARDTILSHRP